mmetsp:Transcript_29934/g.89018  ORF Transcript_29934/g.89018 Transcript_29934/m.89018 type:complete len:85 (-) Transcript_29934:1423-1677(-)
MSTLCEQEATCSSRHFEGGELNQVAETLPYDIISNASRAPRLAKGSLSQTDTRFPTEESCPVASSSLTFFVHVTHKRAGFNRTE